MYALLFVSILTASLCSTVMHKAKISGPASIFRFNLLSSAVWCVLLLLASGFALDLNPEVILWGALYGITQALFILFKTAAMNSGPVSVTSLVGNCSLVISVALCLAIWDEPVHLADVIGLIFLMLGILLTTYKGARGKFTKQWVVFSALFLLLGAAIGIVFKAFAKSAVKDSVPSMMLVASLVMLLSYALISVISGKGKKETMGKKERKAFILAALGVGVTSCIYNRLNISLSAALPSVVFFPSFNGGVVVVSTVLSVILLGERLTKRQIVGILIGVAAITVIGIF